jgi:hypothetical protein
VFTIAIALLAVTTAGLARADSGDKDLERIAKSGEELAKSGGAKFRGTTTTDAGGADSKVTFDGSFDFSHRAGEYSIDPSAIGLEGTGKVRVLLVDGVMYMSLDALQGGSSSSTPALVGKLWLKLDPALFGGEAQIGQSDPNGSLDALRGVTGGARKLGTEKVRGARTTHYRVKLDPAQAVTKAPEELQAQVRGAVRTLGSKAIPADVWIDSRGRLRRVRVRLGGSSTSLKGSITFEYFDLGARISVEAPPESEVVDFAQLLGGGSTTPGS